MKIGHNCELPTLYNLTEFGAISRISMMLGLIVSTLVMVRGYVLLSENLKTKEMDTRNETNKKDKIGSN